MLVTTPLWLAFFFFYRHFNLDWWWWLVFFAIFVSANHFVDAWLTKRYPDPPPRPPRKPSDPPDS
jgi:hypothetical protein